MTIVPYTKIDKNFSEKLKKANWITLRRKRVKCEKSLIELVNWHGKKQNKTKQNKNKNKKQNTDH